MHSDFFANLSIAFMNTLVLYQSAVIHPLLLVIILFVNFFSLLEGGADSGFRHVAPEEYEPRLFHFSGTRKSIVVKQVRGQRVLSINKNPQFCYALL